MTSSINQLRMNMLDIQSFHQAKNNKTPVDNLLEEKTSTKNQQDIKNEFSYDEYMQYCEENAVSQYNSNPSFTFVATTQNTDGQNVRPIHIGRAFASYSHLEEEVIKPYIETEV